MVLYAFLFCMLGADMEKVVGILVFDDVLTSEVTAPAEVFGMAANQEWFKEWKVTLIGLENKAAITTAEGLRILPDTSIDEAPQVTALIVPGAYNLDLLLKNKKLMAFLKKHQSQWLASNCSGAFLLANSGALDGYRATTWFGGAPKLKASFQNVHVEEHQPVVLDRNRLTSNGGVVSYDAAFVLLGKLTSPKHAREIYDHLQAGRQSNWQELAALIEGK